MDRLRDFLDELKKRAVAKGNFLGLLNVLIGRNLAMPDGSPLSSGITWRELAALLKRVRWDKAAVRDLGLDPAQLPPRDRVKYWYTAIARAGVDSDRAMAAGDDLAQRLASRGYAVGPAPSRR
jgi:hypothetical protein